MRNHSPMPRRTASAFARTSALFVCGALLILTNGLRSADKAPEPPAKADDWAFRPVKNPAVPVPPPEFKEWVRTPVDAFVLEKLLAHGLRPSPEADRAVLARRVSIDLTGSAADPGRTRRLPEG